MMSRFLAAACLLFTLCIVPLPGQAAPPALRLTPRCDSARDRATSTAALVVALESKRWRIRAVDFSNGTVEARISRGRNRVTIEATIGASGEVTVRRLKGGSYGRQPWRLPRNWIKHMRHAYEAYSCYAPDKLMEMATRRHYPTRPETPAMQL